MADLAKSINWKAAAITAKFSEPGKSIFKLDLVALRKMKEIRGEDDRVIYARKGDEVVVTNIENGEKITLDVASELKNLCWGSASMPPKNEWIKQAVTLNPQDNLWAYGIIAPRNGTKNFLMCLQAYFLKHLLFEKKGKGKDKETKVTETRRRARNAKKAANGNDGKKLTTRTSESKLRYRRYPKSGQPKAGNAAGISWSQMLKPNSQGQLEMMVGGLTEILMRAADGKDAIFCLPGNENCFEPNAQYGIDGFTEKMRFFKCTKEEDLRMTIKKLISNLTQENGSGLLCFLYSVILSRNFTRIKEDMQDQAETSLIDPMGECTSPLLNLVLFGRATPYLHNGTMYIEDDNGVQQERLGIAGRSDIGFLIWDKDDEKTATYNIGSRLKTPTYPLWVTKCNDQVGVLFNPNKELMRSHNAENRFQLYYYSNGEFKKDERKETILTIDTRSRTGMVRGNHDVDFDEGCEPPLESAIKTKWEGSSIEWNGIVPYVW